MTCKGLPVGRFLTIFFISVIQWDLTKLYNQGVANMAKLYTISRSTHGVGGWFDKKGVSTHGY